MGQRGRTSGPKRASKPKSRRSEGCTVGFKGVIPPDSGEEHEVSNDAIEEVLSVYGRRTPSYFPGANGELIRNVRRYGSVLDKRRPNGDYLNWKELWSEYRGSSSPDMGCEKGRKDGPTGKD
ncbi:unnamed protein product [Dovyalis caffra]|uniref:Uncharacterized protein n=1 Tax=Dovyalis caffra TaxID=77055 RepID=A0AAV1SSH6_9ROSI|nr:unnamed protein product [Dovyalis caffra]